MTAKTKIKPATIAEATTAFDAAVAAADGTAALSAYLHYLHVAKAELNAEYNRRAAEVRERNEATQDVRDMFAALRELYSRWESVKYAQTHLQTGVLGATTTSAADVEAARRAYVELAQKIDARIVEDGHEPYLGISDDDDPRDVFAIRGGVHGAYWEESMPSGGDRRGEGFDAFLAAARKRLGI